jgi:hypothetical protein
MLEFLNGLIEIAKREGAVLAAIVAGTIALVLAVVNPIGSFLVARANSLREIRSTNRQNWIDQFRIEASELVSLVEAIQGGKIQPTGKSYFRRDELEARLILRLNPNELEHQTFKKTLIDFASGVRDGDTVEAQKTRRHEFLLATQNLLKKEWNKVRKGK